MVLKNLLKTAFVSLGTALAVTTVQIFPAFAEEYSDFSFTVTNETNAHITEIWVSEDTEEWKSFEIGNGIAPNTTETLVWYKHTDNENCVQFISATYADGTETTPITFDFCEETNLYFSE